MRRPVSNSNPLVQFNLSVADFETQITRLPEEIRPFSALSVHMAEFHGDETLRNLNSVLTRCENAGIPIYVHVMNYIVSRGRIPVEHLSKALREFSCLKGFVAAELSVTRLQSFDVDYMVELINLAAETGAHFIWQDMGYPYWHNIFLQAGADERLFRAFRDHGEHVILVDKQNGRGQYFLTRAAILGMWGSGLVSAWGVNPEDWWWFEMGYGAPYTPSRGSRGYAVEHSCGSTGGWDLASAWSSPDILYGQTMLTAMAAGATVYSFEMPSHAYGGRVDGSGYLESPAFRNVIAPLAKLIGGGGVLPDREEVARRARIAYQCRSLEEDEVTMPGEWLFRPLYGATRSDAQIMSNCLSPEFINRTGRYYYLPVLPILASEKERSMFERVISPGQFKDDNALRAYFDGVYPDRFGGDALVLETDRALFITNSHANKDRAQDFAVTIPEGPVSQISGRLSAHSLAVVRIADGRVRLHVNNYMVEWPGWDDPMKGAYDTGKHFRSYMTEPDEMLRRPTVLRCVFRGETRPNATWTGVNTEFGDQWDEQTRTLTIVMSHNGPVDITIESGEPCPRCAGRSAGKENAR